MSDTQSDTGGGLYPGETVDVSLNHQGVQRTGANILAPKASIAINTFTKLDELGMYTDMDRNTGESLVNFKHRILQAQAKLPNASTIGVTDGINYSLDLAQFYAIKLNFSDKFKVNVDDLRIQVSGTYLTTVNLIDLDPDGYWIPKNFGQVTAELNNISGVMATVYDAASGMPALLLEQQSSYKMVNSEQINPSNIFRLGETRDIDFSNKEIVSGNVEFLNSRIFSLIVNDQPKHPGEYKVEPDGRVTVYSLPDSTDFVNYVYNIAISGGEFNLIANGARAINLSNPHVQDMMFYSSGIGLTGLEITNEILQVDKMFWGK